jgi:hypothetical protein
MDTGDPGERTGGVVEDLFDDVRRNPELRHAAGCRTPRSCRRHAGIAGRPARAISSKLL